MDASRAEPVGHGAASGIKVIVHGTAWHPQQREIQGDAAARDPLQRPMDVIICVCPCVDQCRDVNIASAAPPTRR
ncbi:MAG TPA: hypothetical protein VHG51_04100 [Longimicrobiaceae bacterium]|nr:hypothetical protein [Longimicrobiaceae bacterium]